MMSPLHTLARSSLLVFAGVTLLACLSCSRSDKSSPAGASSGQSVPNPGERVVVEVARASFIEGIVESGDKLKLTVRVHGSDKTRDVDTANAYRTGGAPRGMDPGALAICELKPHEWRACRVVDKGADGLKVADENGTEQLLAIAHVLRPTEVTKLNLQHIFERAKVRSEFVEGASKAGGPHRPVGWKPKPGDGVVVRSGGSHVSATVKEARSDLILVVLSNGDGSVQALAYDDVWPEPPASIDPAAGDYAYLRPAAGERAWKLVRVDAVADGKVTVANANGEQSTADVKDVLPFAGPR